MVPRNQLGRVASIDMLGSFILLPVGYAIAGWATGQGGPALVFIAGGALTGALHAVAALYPGIHRVD